jgi:hypothetical protein
LTILIDYLMALFNRPRNGVFKAIVTSRAKY